MTIDEAIEKLEEWKNPEWIKHHKEAYAAIKLGIEALKRYRDLRSQRVILAWERLPGETKE